MLDHRCSHDQKEIDPTKVFVIHFAASTHFYQCHDLSQIESVKKKYLIPSEKYVLSLGTLEPRKNIAHTIRCFATLLKQEHIPDLYLVLAGLKDWEYKHIFQTLAEYSVLKDRIIVTGHVPDEDLAALYSGALVFVYPSFYEWVRASTA